MKPFYFHGDECRYTGRTEVMYGGLFFEAELIEGHLTGQMKRIIKWPN